MTKSDTHELLEALKPILDELDEVEAAWQRNYGSTPRKNWTFTIGIEYVRQIREAAEKLKDEFDGSDL